MCRELKKHYLVKIKLIQERLHTDQSRHKGYADKNVCDMAFMEVKKVFLRVSAMKGVIRFGKKGKLRLRFFGPFKLDEDLAYEEESVTIFDRQVRKLSSKDIVSTKVQWRGHPVKEAAWEFEHDIRSIYLCLFSTLGMILNSFEDECLFKRGT
ncbi:uncharacterized protein [Nicotiana tomentosiformis]|uniref:uncharacterized protein n=1 Tax=Nicotiana tomentosiformis TaxID=4098 RepID=UPI00388C42F4